MAVLRFVFGALYAIGYGGNAVLISWNFWRTIADYFPLALIDPFNYLYVMWATVTTPLFWVFLAVTIVGWLGLNRLGRVRVS